MHIRPLIPCTYSPRDKLRHELQHYPLPSPSLLCWSSCRSFPSVRSQLQRTTRTTAATLSSLSNPPPSKPSISTTTIALQQRRKFCPLQPRRRTGTPRPCPVYCKNNPNRRSCDTLDKTGRTTRTTTFPLPGGILILLRRRRKIAKNGWPKNNILGRKKRTPESLGCFCNCSSPYGGRRGYRFRAPTGWQLPR